MGVRPFLSFLFLLTAAFLVFSANPSKVFAAHGEGSSWVENPNLAGCEHCHDTFIEWDTGEVRQITNRDENITVAGGMSGQTHMIVNMSIDSGRTTDIGTCNRRGETCDPASEVPSLWSDVVNYMTEKEPLPLPYDELNAKTYLMNCYDNVAGSSYNGCPMGPGTINDNCNCGPPTTNTSSTSTTTSTSTTSSTTLPPTSTTTSTSTSTTSTSITIGTTSTSSTIVTSSTSTTTTTTLLSASADLALSITDSPDPIQVGDTLTLVYTGMNNGPDAALGVKIFSNFRSEPISVSTSKGSCGLSPPPTFQRPSRPFPTVDTYLTCDVGTMIPGESMQVTIQVRASSPNGASIKGVTPDPDLSNNSDSESTTILGVPTTISSRPTIPRPPRPTIIRPSRGETTSTTSTTTSSTTSTTVAP